MLIVARRHAFHYASVACRAAAYATYVLSSYFRFRYASFRFAMMLMLLTLFFFAAAITPFLSALYTPLLLLPPAMLITFKIPLNYACALRECRFQPHADAA